MVRFIPIFLLCSCGAQYAQEAQVWAKGKPLTQLESCIGVPDRQAALGAGKVVVEWSASDVTFPVTVPLGLVNTVHGLAAALSIPASALSGSISETITGGSCRALATVGANGVVQELRYAGPGDSISGRNAVCGVDIVRGCMRP